MDAGELADYCAISGWRLGAAFDCWVGARVGAPQGRRCRDAIIRLSKSPIPIRDYAVTLGGL